MKTHKYGLQESGIRYLRRQPPLWMKMNLWEGRCFCGKPKELFEPRQIKYCCGKHADWWFWSIRCYWNSFRMMIYRRDEFTCQECGYVIKKEENGFSRCDWEVDHILAICNGGMCFDMENVRLVCRKCHVKKTAKDIGKLTFTKKKLQPLENFIPDYTTVKT